MQVGGLAENVQVIAESPIIDVKQNAATRAMQSEIIERIPKGRNFTTCSSSAPGANQEAKAGLSDRRRERRREPLHHRRHGYDQPADGRVRQARRWSTSSTEVQVKSSGYNAEYRATTGGVISAITKSGGNRFRGGAGIYYSNDDWAGACGRPCG